MRDAFIVIPVEIEERCWNCNAPTHGTLKECPYPRMPSCCDNENKKYERDGNRYIARCLSCGSWFSNQALVV